MKKVFSHDESSENHRKKPYRADGNSLEDTRLALPPGPIIQVRSPRMRMLVDTFLRNTSTVHVAFSAMLQGTDGGFQGDMPGVVLAHVDRESCSAAAAFLPGEILLVHSNNPNALKLILDAIPDGLAPSRIEGESNTVRLALRHPWLAELPGPQSKDCVHLAMTRDEVRHGPGGHHRLARETDRPRLDEYAREYEKETGDVPPSDWNRLIGENRIFLGVVEGTIASVAIRGAETLDHVLIAGVYTFKAFRRRGLARKLVAAMAARAAGRGKSAAMIVGKDNMPMLALADELKFYKTADYTIAIFSDSGE